MPQHFLEEKFVVLNCGSHESSIYGIGKDVPKKETFYTHTEFCRDKSYLERRPRPGRDEWKNHWTSDACCACCWMAAGSVVVVM